MGLTTEQVDAFKNDGVVVVEGVFTDVDLQPVIDGYSRWIDGRAKQLFDEGKISDLVEGEPFEKRFARLYAQSREIEKGMDIMFARLPEMFDFLRNPRLLGAVSRLIGTNEITCNPIQHIRGKVTDLSGGSYFNVPWHQDAAVTWEEADSTDIVTCWLPLVDATEENGCMRVLPGVFRGGVLSHKGGAGGATIPDETLPNVEPRLAAVKKGGVVFMHRCTPHHSTPNHTDTVRWSIDLRYQPTGLPTGRPFHPEFVARSEENPASVLTDHAAWSKLWADALAAPPPARGAHRVSG